MFSLHNYGGLYYRLEPHFLSVYFIPISQYSERRNFAASPTGVFDVEGAIQTQKEDTPLVAYPLLFYPCR